VKRALATEAVGAGTAPAGYDRANMQRKMAQVEWLHVYVKFAVVRALQTTMRPVLVCF
jgi:hypothetical protein